MPAITFKAFSTKLLTVDPMLGTWQQRLKAKVEEDGRSMRAISLAAGLGANYLSEVLGKDKEPGVEKLLRICAELHVSATYLITGADLGHEDEGFLALLSGLDDSDRSTLLDLARKLQKHGRLSK